MKPSASFICVIDSQKAGFGLTASAVYRCGGSEGIEHARAGHSHHGGMYSPNFPFNLQPELNASAAGT